MPQSWQTEVDVVLLFSIIPGSLLLLLLLSESLTFLSVFLALGFLCFYPGYLFVRRINISGLILKFIISIGLSVALVVCIGLISLVFGRWAPEYQTALIVLIVFTDVIFGKGSILSYLFPVLDLSSVWKLAKAETVSAVRSQVGVMSSHQNSLGREIVPEPNFLWQIEFVKVNSTMLRREVELVVVSDLITQECLAAIAYRTGFSKILTDQLSWICHKQNAPQCVELHQFGEFDHEKIAAWLNQNYSKTIVVPKNQHYEAYLRYQLADYVDRRVSPSGVLGQQLDDWRYNYNQSLRITLPSNYPALEAV